MPPTMNDGKVTTSTQLGRQGKSYVYKCGFFVIADIYGAFTKLAMSVYAKRLSLWTCFVSSPEPDKDRVWMESWKMETVVSKVTTPSSVNLSTI